MAQKSASAARLESAARTSDEDIARKGHNFSPVVGGAELTTAKAVAAKLMADKTKVSSFGHVRLWHKVDITPDSCVLPKDKLDHPTPSSKEGVSAELEGDVRFLGCELIQSASILLKLPQVAAASGQILFQKYFYSKSIVRNNFEHVAMACVCLASKVEEAPRRPRDVINVFHHLKQLAKIRHSHADKRPLPMTLDQNYISLKNHVIKAERRILNTLGFCVHVKHPHKMIYTYLQALSATDNHELIERSWVAESEHLAVLEPAPVPHTARLSASPLRHARSTASPVRRKRVAKGGRVWRTDGVTRRTLMNDGLRVDMFVRYSAETIACACIFLAARYLKVPLPLVPRPWWELFDATTDDVTQIANILMRMYTMKKSPNWMRIERRMNELKALLTVKSFEAAKPATASPADHRETTDRAERDRGDEEDAKEPRRERREDSRRRADDEDEGRKRRDPKASRSPPPSTHGPARHGKNVSRSRSPSRSKGGGGSRRDASPLPSLLAPPLLPPARGPRHHHRQHSRSGRDGVAPGGGRYEASRGVRNGSATNSPPRDKARKRRSSSASKRVPGVSGKHRSPPGPPVTSSGGDRTTNKSEDDSSPSESSSSNDEEYQRHRHRRNDKQLPKRYQVTGSSGERKRKRSPITVGAGGKKHRRRPVQPPSPPRPLLSVPRSPPAAYSSAAAGAGLGAVPLSARFKERGKEREEEVYAALGRKRPSSTDVRSAHRAHRRSPTNSPPHARR